MNITRIAQPGRLGQPWVREIVPGVFRVGTTFLGWYAVEDAGRLHIHRRGAARLLGPGSLGPARSRSSLGGKSAAGRQAGPADRGPDTLKGLPGSLAKRT